MLAAPFWKQVQSSYKVLYLKILRPNTSSPYTQGVGCWSNASTSPNQGTEPVSIRAMPWGPPPQGAPSCYRSQIEKGPSSHKNACQGAQGGLKPPWLQIMELRQSINIGTMKDCHHYPPVVLSGLLSSQAKTERGLNHQTNLCRIHRLLGVAYFRNDWRLEWTSYIHKPSNIATALLTPSTCCDCVTIRGRPLDIQGEAWKIR